MAEIGRRGFVKGEPRNPEPVGRGTQHLPGRRRFQSDLYDLRVVAARRRAHGVAVGNADELNAIQI
jgi:hypothetical protein